MKDYDTHFISASIANNRSEKRVRVRRKKTFGAHFKLNRNISKIRAFAKDQTNSKLRNLLVTEDEAWSVGDYRRVFDYAYSVD